MAAVFLLFLRFPFIQAAFHCDKMNHQNDESVKQACVEVEKLQSKVDLNVSPNYILLVTYTQTKSILDLPSVLKYIYLLEIVIKRHDRFQILTEFDFKWLEQSNAEIKTFLTGTERKTECEKYAEYLIKFTSKILKFREEDKFLPITRNKYPLGRIMLEFSRKPNASVSSQISIDCRDTLDVFDVEKLQISYGKYFPDYQDIGLCGECEKLRQQLLEKTSKSLGEPEKVFRNEELVESHPHHRTRIPDDQVEVPRTQSTRNRSKSAKPLTSEKKTHEQFRILASSSAQKTKSNKSYLIPDYGTVPKVEKALSRVRLTEDLGFYLLIQLFITVTNETEKDHFVRIYVAIKMLLEKTQTAEEKHLLLIIAKKEISRSEAPNFIESRLRDLIKDIKFPCPYPEPENWSKIEERYIACGKNYSEKFGILNAIAVSMFKISDKRVLFYVDKLQKDFCPGTEDAIKNLKTIVSSSKSKC
jgi:hypothetical protein